MIPESDHQIVANLIALVALIITVIISIWSISEGRKSRRIATKANQKVDEANGIAKEANNKADKANEISFKALTIAKEDHQAKYFPILEAIIDIMVEDVDNSDFDHFEIKLTNTVNTELTITKIDIEHSSIFVTDEIKDIKAPYNLPLLIRFHFVKNSHFRQALVDKIKGTPDTKNHEQRLAEQVDFHIVNMPIYVWFTFNEVECLANLKFSGTALKYIGNSMKLQ